MNPDGGPAIPVSVNTDRAIMGGTAIPVYGYASAPTDGRPAQAGAAMPVRVLTAADLVQNGGTWVLEGRYAAMPVYTAPASSGVIGGPAIAVYPINAWPPSNVTPAWAPSDIAGLALWLKSDAGLFQDAAKTTPAVADADPVGAWADQSGNARDMTQATAGNRPALKLNIKNGRAVVRGDGSNDSLASAAFGLARPTRIYMVARFLQTRNYETLMDGTNANSARLYATPNQIYSGAELLNIAGTYTDWHLWSILFHATASTVTLDGGGVQTGLGALSDAGGFQLFPSQGGNFGNCDVGELLIYSPDISVANDILVKSYLNTRWAVY